MDNTEYRLARPVINGKQSRKWYVLWRERGRERRVSTRETDKYAAEGFLAAFVAGKNAPPARFDINWILDQYEEDRKDAKSASQTHYNLRAVRQVFGAHEPEAVSADAVKIAARRWRAAGSSDGTIRTRLLLFRAACNWAVKMKYIDAAPYIPAPPPGAPRGRFLTREEFERLYAAAEEQHLRTYLALAVWSGLRTGAILALRWGDIDRERMLIIPKGGSANKKKAIVRINTALALTLGRAWMQRDGPYVIHWQGEQVKSVRRSFYGAVRRSGIDKVTMHDLRRTCASWLAMNGVSMDRIATILGDTIAVTQKHYAHLSPDYLRDEMEGIG